MLQGNEVAISPNASAQLKPEGMRGVGRKTLLIHELEAMLQERASLLSTLQEQNTHLRLVGREMQFWL